MGVFFSRKIALACDRDLVFMAIVGNQRANFRTIGEFRKHHQSAIKPLLLEILRIADKLQIDGRAGGPLDG